MSKRLIVTLAVGDKSWGQRALSLALSLKANDDEQEVMLIYTPSAIAGIEELVDTYFDYGIQHIQTTDTATEYAFYLKTQLYDIVTQAVPDATEILFLDADTIMLPGKSVNDWFAKHEGRSFTAYCNDIYDYKTKQRKRKDYTFWCDPEQVKFQLDIPDNRMPQINTSFIYFEKGVLAKHYFQTVSDIWDNDRIEYKEYKNVKPDELCFNIASAITNMLPHQTTYRPIFFECFASTYDTFYINHNFQSFGFAGELPPKDGLVKYYNDTSDYYRKYFGITDFFRHIPEPLPSKDFLSIQPEKRRTLYRRGELLNSDGGVFNPSALIHKGELVTVYRKEAGIEKNMYIGTSSIPHIEYQSGESKELKIDIDSSLRVEDFRIFEHRGMLMFGHSVGKNIYTTNVECKCGLSVSNDGYLHYMGVPDLPVSTNKVEKNWTFFSEGERLFCLYKLSPYTLFYSDDLITWRRFAVGEKKLKWVNDKFISNSSNPILIGDSYLVFFHSLTGQGGYYHGACLIDAKTKQLTHFTPRALNIVSGKEGLMPKITYVSGAVYFKDRDVVRVYCGEADSHAIYNEFNATRLLREVKKYKV